MSRNASLKKALDDTVVVAPSSPSTPQNVREDDSGRSTRQNPSPQIPRPEYVPFAEALRTAMLKQGLSASEVARRVWGSTKDTRGYDVARNRDRIGHYLNGTSYPEPENLQLLADALGLVVEDLAIDRPIPIVGTTGASRRQPADVHFTMLADQPDKARMQFDRVISFETGLRILQMLKEEERLALKTVMPPSGRSFGKPEPELRSPAHNPSVTAPTAN